MPNNGQRLTAVIAALEEVRGHVDGFDTEADMDTSAYNRWVGMLDGVVEGNWQSLKLPDGTLEAGEYLMHIDAAIAFLKAHA
jgi:hypothetical protein